MVGNFNLVMVLGCNCLSSNTICLTLSVLCFYNFTYFVFDMYGSNFCFISAIKEIYDL